jgi:hypothetical protein
VDGRVYVSWHARVQAPLIAHAIATCREGDAFCHAILLGISWWSSPGNFSEMRRGLYQWSEVTIMHNVGPGRHE